MVNDGILEDLRVLLGFEDEEPILTIPDNQSVAVAENQLDALLSLELEDENMESLLSVVDALDLLSDRYIPEGYVVDSASSEDIAGLQTSYEHAVQAIMFGVAGVLFEAFPEQPQVFTALFGERLGAILRYHGKQELDRLEQIADLRAAEAPIAEIEAAVKAMSDAQVELAVALGTPESLAQGIADFLFADRVAGNVIDLDTVVDELEAVEPDE